MKYGRTFNFSAGPAMMPEPVLEEIRDEMMNYRGSGMCVMEMSHRSKVFQQIIDEAEADLRELMNIPDNYKVLFIQGGGTLQFAFDAAGGAKMIQGGGTLNGTYQYLDDGSVGVIFDYNGEELRYACIFTWTDEDELLMVAISDAEGADGVYFVQ